MTEVKTITTEEVQERLENGETLFLVDVREDEEVAAGKFQKLYILKWAIFQIKWISLRKRMNISLFAVRECVVKMYAII